MDQFRTYTRFELPSLGSLEAELPGLIRDVASKGLFGENPVLTVTYRKK